MLTDAGGSLSPSDPLFCACVMAVSCYQWRVAGLRQVIFAGSGGFGWGNPRENCRKRFFLLVFRGEKP